MPLSTHVVGNLFVIQDPDGTLVTTVGSQQTVDDIAIYTLLRATFGDHYDFVSCYVDAASGMPNEGAHAGPTIYNNVTGIGRWTYNFRSSYLSSTKLQGMPHYTFFNLATLLHEVGHRWCASVNYTDTPGGPSQYLLHQDWVWTPGGESSHWGRWMDNDNSSMDYDQADWIDNGDGTFNRIDYEPTLPAYEEWFAYCPLDLYLMGLIPASSVPPIVIVRNPSPAIAGEGGPYGVPTGPYTPTPSVLSVPIAWIQNPKAEDPNPVFSGPRTPGHLSSERVFHEAVVIITKNTSLSAPFITNSDTWRQRHTAHFRRATGGRAMVDTSLLRANYADLYVRDNAADTGGPTSSPPFWLSPDLWVRNADDGETPGNDVNQNTLRPQSNWIYGRVHNKSSQAYENVTVNFYLANFLDLAPGTEFLYPVDWNPQGLLGSDTLVTVPAGGSAIAKIEWTADKIPPATGWHPCLLCEVIPMEVGPSGLHHVFENRKLAQRNITIIDPPTPPPPGGGGGGRGGGGGGGRGGAGGGGMRSGYFFGYEFWIGHELRPAQGAQLRLSAERHLDEVRLFLDAAGLVEGIAEYGERLDLEIPLDATRTPSGAEGVQPLPAGKLAVESGPRAPRLPSRLCGLTLRIPKGTEVGIAPQPDRPECDLRVHFEDEVRIQIGHPAAAPEERYRLRGLRPVVLNGLPLLEVTDPNDASLVLPLAPHERRKLRLFGLVPGGRDGNGSALYHITERLADRVLGGVSLEVRV